MLDIMIFLTHVIQGVLIVALAAFIFGFAFLFCFTDVLDPKSQASSTIDSTSGDQR